MNYILANNIWPLASVYKDLGLKTGLFRGYNLELQDEQGNIDWTPCEYIAGDPEIELFDEAHLAYYTQLQMKPTGGIVFRGYAKQIWNEDMPEPTYEIVELENET